MDNERLKDYLASYKHEIEYALADGEGPILKKVRQVLSEQALSPGERFALDIDDEAVIASVIELDEVADYLLADDDSQPLQNWWWHLGKLRNQTYPADLLPAHLRAVYYPGPKDRS